MLVSFVVRGPKCQLGTRETVTKLLRTIRNFIGKKGRRGHGNYGSGTASYMYIAARCRPRTTDFVELFQVSFLPDANS